MKHVHFSRSIPMTRGWSRLCLGALCCALLGGVSCSEDDGDGGPAVEGALGRNRPPPRGSVFIDRAGRVAITAALIETFNPDDAERNGVLVGYNSVPTGNRLFLPTMQTSLGVLDALDGTCGNQLLAGDEAAAGRYLPLAEVLLDDRLYLNRSRSGSVYLGVEGEAIDALDNGEGAGGGRAPGDDTIERSYSVLAAGALDSIDDGVTQDDAQATPSTFPFLAAP